MLIEPKRKERLCRRSVIEEFSQAKKGQPQSNSCIQKTAQNTTEYTDTMDHHHDVLGEDDDYIITYGRQYNPTHHPPQHYHYNYYDDYDHHQRYYQQQPEDSNASFPTRLVNGIRQLFFRSNHNTSEASSSNWGVVLALVVVVTCQFQTTLWALYYKLRQDGLWNTCMDGIFSILDVIRAYFQLTQEVVRSIRRAIGMDEWLGFDVTGNDLTFAPRNHYALQHSFDGGGGGGFFTHFTNPLTTTFHDPPPPLVIFDPTRQVIVELTVNEEDVDSELDNNRPPNNHEGNTTTTSTPMSSSNSSLISTDPIEPAFLSEEDYPPGWLVYHSVLGVVSKEEADAYDQQQKKQRYSINKQMLEDNDHAECAYVPQNGTVSRNGEESSTNKDRMKGRDYDHFDSTETISLQL